MIDDHRFGRHGSRRKGTLAHEDIGQTAVDIRQYHLLHDAFTCIDPGTHGIDAHPDNRVAWKLTAEMNMSLDGSGRTLRCSRCGM